MKNTIDKALDEKKERKIQNVLFDLKLLNFMADPYNCYELAKFSSYIS